jgi:threonine dehydrogenase-like Zn-dependent dehydrogenase
MREGSVIGHEFVGTVAQAGVGTRFQPGTRVVGSFLIACGVCGHCSRGRYNFCIDRRALGLGPLTGDLDGAQAEYVRVPVADVNLKALDGKYASLSDEAALFGGDIMTTGVYAAAHAGVDEGETVAVIGAGPVGLFTALGCVGRNAGRVLVLDQSPQRTVFARENFSLEAIDISGRDASEAISEATNGEGADVAFDAVGSPAVLKSAMRCVRDGGRVTVVGVYGPERYELPLGMTWVRGLDLRFTGMADIQKHWDEALGSVVAGTFDPTLAITHRLPLDDAEEGYELFASKKAMKVVLRP